MLRVVSLGVLSLVPITHEDLSKATSVKLNIVTGSGIIPSDKTICEQVRTCSLQHNLLALGGIKVPV